MYFALKLLYYRKIYTFNIFQYALTTNNSMDLDTVEFKLRVPLIILVL